MTKKLAVTAIILAGGASKRMGSDKGLVKFGSKLLVEYIVEAAQASCQEVLVITNEPGKYQLLGLPCLPDIKIGLGPMAGLLTGLENSKSDINLLLSCDMPFVTAEVLRFLGSHADDRTIVVSELGGQMQPFLAAYPKDSIIRIKRLIKDGSLALRDLIFSSNHRVLHEQDFASAGIDFEWLAFSVNSPDDLAIAEDHLKEMTYE